jgi:hypothetical protein
MAPNIPYFASLVGDGKLMSLVVHGTPTTLLPVL